jgi:16S rRNA (uracil1498-N3)-methyltransferase
MRIHRFYISTPISGKTFDVADRDLVHQWRSVFRYNVGSQVMLFDGSGTDHLCIISSLRNSGATVSVLRSTEVVKNISRSVVLCMALIKKDNFEMVTQKATELGVSTIVPILTERTEKKKLNMERLQKIAVEASEQSGRGDVPEIHKETTLSELFEGGVLPQDKIAIDPTGTDFHKYVSTLSLVGNIAVFVGPEGGFSEKEVEFFKQYNVLILSLGTQILRAETAAIAVSSLLLL